MRRHLLVLSILGVLLTLSLAGCGDDDDGGSGDAADLSGTEWKAASFGSDEVLPDVSSTLVFHTDGTISGSTGCNGYNGTWEGDGADLTLTVGPMTAMACDQPVMEQESSFVRAVSETRTFDLDDDTLELQDDDGETMMTLTTLERATLTQGTWNVTGYNNGTGGVVSVAEGTTMTAVFTDDGKLSGSAGCNEYNTTYTVDGATISIPMAATTRMACDQPVMDQETAYLTALTGAATHELGERTLSLMAADGSLLVSYELAP